MISKLKTGVNNWYSFNWRNWCIFKNRQKLSFHYDEDTNIAENKSWIYSCMLTNISDAFELDCVVSDIDRIICLENLWSVNVKKEIFIGYIYICTGKHLISSRAFFFMLKK